MTESIVPPELLAIMQCSSCGDGLEPSHEPRALICSACGRHYPVDERGIPDMVVEDTDEPQGDAS